MKGGADVIVFFSVRISFHLPLLKKIVDAPGFAKSSILTIWGSGSASYTDRTQCQQQSEDDMNNKKASFFATATIILAIATPIDSLAAGIVSSVEKAPVIADGNVTGMPTDIVITLDRSLDPSVPGRTLAKGGQIRVMFPPEFDLGNLNPAFPVSDVPNFALPCVPGNLQCTTAVVLKGWPQDPFFPPFLFHTHTIDTADNAFVFTAVQDMDVAPGIKQLHIMLHGVANPAPGQYLIRVEAQTGPNGSWESGSGMYRVLPRTRPSINSTSVLVKAWSAGACGPGTLPPNPDNPIYQATGINSDAPFAWTLNLWGKNNEALDNVTLRWVNPDHALLRRNGATIGHVSIDAPAEATGYGIAVNPLGCGTVMPFAPVIATTPGIGPQPVGRLDLLFRTGTAAGRYTTTISINNGNSVQMIVDAQ
jgi:hypothetical protein